MQELRVLILATDGRNSRLLYNTLKKEHPMTSVILEDSIPKTTFLKIRIKKIGFIKAISQAAFILFILPFIKDKRSQKLIVESGFNATPIPENQIQRVSSFHNPEVIQMIQKAGCDLVILNGTRILKKTLLSQIKVPTVNIHTGITPEFRGVHGGYWANYFNKLDLFGVTLHYVNSGVDTGEVIAQKVIEINKKDNFKSYPTLQYLNGIQLLLTHTEAILKNKKQLTEPLTKESHQHYHPGFFQYLAKRISKGIK
jgi:folate-dependent phosphoribosylglycinamide formyltransferase PurN